jgi:hypothetical protein
MGTDLMNCEDAKHLKATRRRVQTQHDLMACQLGFDGVRRSVDLEAAIRFHPSWIPSPVKGVDKVDQDPRSQARLGIWAAPDELLLGADCDNCALDGAAAG